VMAWARRRVFIVVLVGVWFQCRACQNRLIGRSGQIMRGFPLTKAPGAQALR
jgi:pyruvate-formate lyase-activating enzyme